MIKTKDKDGNTVLTFNKRKKLEFMQKILIAIVVISTLFTAWSYILSILDKNPLEELSSTIIQTLWGTSGIGLGAYMVQNCVRAVTGSKWGYPDIKENKTENEEAKG